MTIARKIMAHAKSIFAIAFTIIALSCASPAASHRMHRTRRQPARRPQQQPAQVQDDVRNVLSQYGRFVQHQKYGEVWVPDRDAARLASLSALQLGQLQAVRLVL